MLLPLHILMNLTSILWFAPQGRGGVILRAKRDARLGPPKMWRKRQLVQSTRIATVREIWRLVDGQAHRPSKVRFSRSPFIVLLLPVLLPI
jgi:hypothetical protein